MRDRATFKLDDHSLEKGLKWGHTVALKEKVPVTRDFGGTPVGEATLSHTDIGLVADIVLDNPLGKYPLSYALGGQIDPETGEIQSISEVSIVAYPSNKLQKV